jgi:rhodanese-related sulfurtransferase
VIRLGTYRSSTVHNLQDACHAPDATHVAEGVRPPEQIRGRARYRPEAPSNRSECTSLRLVAADLSPQQVADRLADGSIQLIDVREPYEHEAGHIPGDRLIGLAQLSSEAATLDRDHPVVFYCRGGARSAMATEAFAKAGFEAHNMTGGLLAWNESGLPLDPDGGVVADH